MPWPPSRIPHVCLSETRVGHSGGPIRSRRLGRQVQFAKRARGRGRERRYERYDLMVTAVASERASGGECFPSVMIALLLPIRTDHLQMTSAKYSRFFYPSDIVIVIQIHVTRQYKCRRLSQSPSFLSH